MARGRGSKDRTARSYLYPIAGGTPAPLPGVEPGERVLRWTADGTGIFVSNLRGVPQRIVRVDVATGRRTPVQGVDAGTGLRCAADGDLDDARRPQVLFSYSRLLSSLYVVTGLK